jgi:hypothetical protein
MLDGQQKEEVRHSALKKYPSFIALLFQRFYHELERKQ